MAKELKSKSYQVSVSRKYESDEIYQIIEHTAKELGLYISHIGGYSRKKYPNSIH